MARLFRGLIIFGLACALMVGSAGVALAASVVSDGMIQIRVTEHTPDGVDLYIPVPAAVVNWALSLAPMVIPAEELAEIRREMAPFRDALGEVADEIENMPSTVLVKVETDHERVEVVKDGGSFDITVDSSDADVEVSVPAHLISRVVDLMAG